MSRQARQGRSRRAAWLTAAALTPGLACLVVALLFAPRACERPAAPDLRAPAAFVVVSPPSGRAPLRVRLDATGSSDDVGITLYRWDFGDGTTGEGEVVDHVYRSAGLFEVRLVASDAAGLSGHALAQVHVTAPADQHPPVARMRLSTRSCQAPCAVDGDGSASSDDRGIAWMRWHFSDGGTVDGKSAQHTFALPGRHQVRLEVADLAGNVREVQDEVVVEPGPASAPPKAALRAGPAHAVAPAEVEFDASGSSDDRAIVLYRWNFGDGQSAEGRQVHHRYARAGHFTAYLTVFDDAAQSDHTSVQLDVAAPPSVTERVLFGDELAPGVKDGSWAQVVPVQAPVHAGRRALRVQPAGPWGALRLRFAAERLDAYDRVGFWIQGSEVEEIHLRAVLADGEGEKLGPEVRLSEFLLAGLGGQLDGVWRRAAVPLSALGAEGRPITGFVWQAGGEAHPAAFVVDDVSLLPPDVELPVLSDCALPPPVKGFVERKGTSLEADGVPFRAVGANLYYLQQELSRHVQTGEKRPLALVRQALSAATCAGVSVVRLLAFNDNPPESQDDAVIQTAPGVYREAGLLGLDLAVAEAKAQHLRVILTLTNNWSHYGGLPRYASWAGVAPNRALEDEDVRGWVADYAQMLANRVNAYTGVRYQDEPAILAVELVNELRCPGCRPGHDAVSFQQAFAKAVRQAWPNHLLGDGGEGFDETWQGYPGLEGESVVRGDEGTSFRRLAQLPELDLVSYHLYPALWGLGGEQAGFYVDAHERLAHQAGKVAYLGEFGVRAVDEERALDYDRWLDRLFTANGGALGLVWQVTYPGRPDNDGFALEPGHSARSMAALARHAHELGHPGLDGVSLAARPRALAP